MSSRKSAVFHRVRARFVDCVPRARRFLPLRARPQSHRAAFLYRSQYWTAIHARSGASCPQNSRPGRVRSGVQRLDNHQPATVCRQRRASIRRIGLPHPPNRRHAMRKTRRPATACLRVASPLSQSPSLQIASRPSQEMPARRSRAVDRCHTTSFRSAVFASSDRRNSGKIHHRDGRRYHPRPFELASATP